MPKGTTKKGKKVVSKYIMNCVMDAYCELENNKITVSTNLVKEGSLDGVYYYCVILCSIKFVYFNYAAANLHILLSGDGQ